MTTRLALLSDIHGNLPALEAVLADVARRGVTSIANLGDSLSGPLFPRETADFLMRQGWLQLAGNHERQLLTLPPEAQKQSDRFAHERLEPRVFAWMETLPKTATLEDRVLLCHGTPLTDCEYFLETVEAAGLRQASDEEIVARRGNGPRPVIACGHSHLPRRLRGADGTLYVNPGSVGLQAFRDDHGFPHVVETGSPHARYAVLTVSGAESAAELIAVPYDHASCADLARRNGRSDWEHALLTGTALPG